MGSSASRKACVPSGPERRARIGPPSGSRAGMTRVAQSALLFLAAGLCEIGGGYLVWLWLRNGRGVALGALGGLILFLYGVLPTLQPAGYDLGRACASYAGANSKLDPTSEAASEGAPSVVSAGLSWSRRPVR